MRLNRKNSVITLPKYSWLKLNIEPLREKLNVNKNITPVISSSIGYWNENGALQYLHLPLR